MHPDDPTREFPDESEWLELEPEAVSPDFVERTLQRIAADRGAAREGDPDFPTGFFEAYRAPEPSSGFVDRVAAAVREQDLQSRAMERVLAQFRAPEPSRDFVERTLRALLMERPPRIRRLWTNPWTRAAGLAAAVLVATLLLWPRTEREPRGMRSALAATWVADQAPRYSPNATAALFSHVLDSRVDEFPAPSLPDPLVRLARESDE